MKRLLHIFCGVTAVILVSHWLNGWTPAEAEAPTIQEEKPAPAVISVLPDSLDLWLDRLIQLESNGREDIVILDVNGKYSRGCLQFQDATFNSYVKRYGISGEIMSCSFQKKLARMMIEDDPANWRHWYNSVAVRGLGLPPKSIIL